MTSAVRVLGQLNPAATALTTLYTVPTATRTTVSSITICNQTAGTVTFRIAVRVAGAAINAKQYLYYDQSIKANLTFIATVGLTLGPADVVSVYASSASMSFQAFGVEVT